MADKQNFSRARARERHVREILDAHEMMIVKGKRHRTTTIP